MVGRVSVLISTYGNPWKRYPPQGDDDYSWREVEYVLGSESMVGRTTLPLLYRRHSPDLVLIVVLDTVIYRGDFKSYDDLVKQVEDLYVGFATQMLASICGSGCSDALGRLRVFVAPGIGSVPWIGEDRSVVVRVCGDPMDFYAYVLSSLALEFLSILRSSRDGIDLEVVLDLSHGINYMPVLTYRAVRDIMPIVSLATSVRNAKLLVYNTDPVTPAARSILQRISVNIVEETIFKESDAQGVRRYVEPGLEAIKDLRLLTLNRGCVEEERAAEKGRSISNSVRALVDKHFSSYLELFEKRAGVRIEDKLSAFAGSIINGLPLVTLYTVPQIVAQALYREIFDLYRKQIEIRSNERAISIRRTARIRGDLIALLKILLLSEIVRTSLNIDTQEREPTLRRLVELKDKIFSANDKMEAIIGSELDRLREAILRTHDRMCRNTCHDSWLSLRCIIEGEAQIAARDPDKRNFLAHSGLERNITCYKYDASAPAPDERIRLRYSEEHIDKVYALSQSGLLRI